MLFIACLLAIIGSASAQPAQSSQPVERRSGVEHRTDQGALADQLQRLLSFENQLGSAVERATFRAIIDQLARRVTQSGERPLPCHRQRAVGRAELVEIQNSLRAFSDDASRLTVIGLAAETHCLSIAQVRAIVVMVKDMQLRLDALIQLRPRVTDPKRFHTLLTLLDTPGKRQALLKAINDDGLKP
ncbi:MAG: DUF4476 domain-containing protein [Myxococcota bacterium]|nr:DUF4476 domain-containing protein [Myxococcota bacterium]